MLSIQQLKKSVKLKLLAKLLKGNNVYCNICDNSFSTFLPYLGRVNTVCPVCGSLERTRLIYEFMKFTGFLEPNIRLLHVAPEKCFYDILTKKQGANYVPADKFEEGGYKYPPKTIYMDITDIQFPDESFDAIICVHVLEHVQEDAKALSEMYRVLKKGGMAILQVPFEPSMANTYEDPTITDPVERKKHFQQSDHVRIYGMDFIDRFLKPGFTIEHRNFVDTLDETLRKKLVLAHNQIFLLRK